jgi:lipopolysaccharide export system protein LptA
VPAIVSFSFSEKIEITSTSMKAEDLKKEAHFSGDVKIKKGKDWLYADEIVVYFTKNNDVKRYEASGSVSFEVKTEKSSHRGKANKVVYFPEKSLYILSGKAMVNDLLNKRHVNGEKITLDATTNDVNVQGSKKKPVKFILDMKEK